MPDSPNQWTEEDSQLYQQIAPVAVPHRAEQLAALLTLLPFNRQDTFHAVEVGSGQGILSQTLLTCFPNATITALDGSAEMRAQAAQRLAKFGRRARIEPFELMSDEWQAYLQNANAVLSSLVIHHLPGRAKQALFKIIHQRLSTRGALLIADLIEPQRPEARLLFAATWDRIAQKQSVAETGTTALFEKFKQAHWNYYRFNDPADRPSPLFEQLLWLNQAGFAVVDCFWLQAGHAIYGGYKAGAAAPSEGVSFETALEAVEKVMSAA